MHTFNNVYYPGSTLPYGDLLQQRPARGRIGRFDAGEYERLQVTVGYEEIQEK